MTLAGVVAAGVAVVYLARHVAPIASVVVDHPSAGVLAGAMACGFVIARGCLLSQAARLAGLSVTAGDGCRLFCEGVAVEMVAWPGKVWADLYRAASLPSATTWQRGMTLVGFRAATLASSLVLAVLTLGFWAPELRWPQVLAGLTAVALGWCVLRRRLRQGDGRIIRGATLLGLGVVAGLCDLAAISMLAWMLAGVNPLSFAGWFVLAGALAAASSLPLGLGVLDLGCWHVLTHQFGVEPATAAGIVALYRLTGPTPTLLLGALGLLARVTPWRQVVAAAPAHSEPSLHPVHCHSSPRWSEVAVEMPRGGGFAATGSHS